MIPRSIAGFFVFLSFLFGVFVHSFLPVSPLIAVGIGALGVSLITVGAFLRRSVLLLGFLVFAASLGLWRMAEAGAPNPVIEAVIGEERVFHALVIESPVPSGSASRIVTRTDELADTSMRLLVIAHRFPEYERGETIEVRGIVDSVDSDQFPLNLKRRGIEGVVRFPEIRPVTPQPFSSLKYLNAVTKAFREALHGALPEPDAGYVLGILIGERSSISSELREAFNRTGTSHIVALSGFNITIIAVFIGGIVGWFHWSPRVRFVTITVFIALFVLLVEGGASVIRAAVMGILGLLARERSRVYEMTNALVFAGAVMVFLNPYLLRFDLSFQLSFLATLGIIIVPPYIRSLFNWLPGFLDIRENTIAAISAELFVFPLILWHFGIVSVVGPLANLLVLPFISLTMLGGFIVGVLGTVSFGVARLVGWVLHVLVSYELGAIKALAHMDVSAVSLPAFVAWIFAVPAFLLTSIYFYRRLSHGIRLAR
ncbi:MAG: ComEC/Rec2 family competence protein [Candidatus Sungbacteria bacterium]|nr:ComEC/Rec2 family competence protein [Candidatus Sungbacteria bacterium]